MEVAPEMELFLENLGQYIKKICDKINLHTNLYISPFYKKIVSRRICLKRHSATFICGNSLPNTTLVTINLVTHTLSIYPFSSQLSILRLYLNNLYSRIKSITIIAKIARIVRITWCFLICVHHQGIVLFRVNSSHGITDSQDRFEFFEYFACYTQGPEI